MSLLQILILAIVQGATELLPVSSSAHVIFTEKWMGLDPTAPPLTLLLVMLHTGTMFAVIAYFWRSWRADYFASATALRANALLIAIATALTALVGLALLVAIEYAVRRHSPDFEIEMLFGNSRLISTALGATGLLIILASRTPEHGGRALTLRGAAWIGAVQGLCLPFRGFSRSGATISTGLLLGAGRRQAEQFSFALAVVITPPVIAREAWRLYKATGASAGASSAQLWHAVAPSLLGMALSFAAGLAALRWLSSWLERGRWYWFGVYCIIAGVIVRFLG